MMVSICCISYNHEKYIRDALEGFVNQKTNFDYEIVVHDDASTDTTQAIIREYGEKYPHLFRTILQEENQYSKGREIFVDVAFPYCRGKYIAVCEGDDYWIDSDKLQKQIDYLEANEECSMCFHNAMLLDEQTGEKSIFLKEKDNRIYNSGELAIKGFIPTASVMFRKKYLATFPEWMKSAVVGDFPLALVTSSYGYSYYLKDTMSVYRTNVNGSATERFLLKSNEEKVAYIKGFLNILNNFDAFSKYKYFEDVSRAKIPWEIRLNLYKEESNNLRKKRYFKYLSNREKLLVYLPVLYKILKFFKKKVVRNG